MKVFNNFEKILGLVIVRVCKEKERENHLKF